MKTPLFILALLTSAYAQEAQVVSAMPARDGGMVRLYTDMGQCVGKARRAERTLGESIIVGCWVIRLDAEQPERNRITIGWQDGDVDSRKLSEVQGGGV